MHDPANLQSCTLGYHFWNGDRCTVCDLTEHGTALPPLPDT